jgi:hypothetical protein
LPSRSSLNKNRGLVRELYSFSYDYVHRKNPFHIID